MGDFPAVQTYRAQPDEVMALRLLARQWQGSFWNFDAILGALSRPQGRLFYIPAEGKEPLQWTAMILLYVEVEVCDLLFIYVNTDSRGHGLAKELMTHATRYLAEHPQRPALMLEVRPSNAAAISLYKGLGFQLLNRRARYYSDGEDALVYRKEV